MAAKGQPTPKPKAPAKGARLPVPAPKGARKGEGAPKAPRPGKRASKPRKGATGGPREGSKTALIAGLLTRKQGCTTADVLKATGWPAVSMPQQAKAVGVGLRKEKDGKVSRYWAA
jgi:hypothetical protein